MKIIRTPRIPVPKGHYSPALEHNGTLYVSGQVPVDPDSGKVPEGIEEQTRLVFAKIRLILEESGSSLDRVLQARIYLTDINLWDAVNRVYAEIFGDHKPARCVVPAGKLHFGCLIEAEVVAFV